MIVTIPEIYQDFGDFKTQELDSLTTDDDEGGATEKGEGGRPEGGGSAYSHDLRRVSAFGSEFKHLDSSRLFSPPASFQSPQSSSAASHSGSRFEFGGFFF